MAVERRDFVKLVALGLAGGVAAGCGSPDAPEPAGGAGTSPDQPARQDASGASDGGRRWAMVVDVNACVRDQGCRDCTAACHRVHNVPAFRDPKDEVKWIWKEPFTEALPDERHDYLPAALRDGQVLVLCNHCAVPACTRVCPTGATWRRADGIVMMDWHRCIGCRYCIAACPYGSRSFNWRDPRPAIARIDPGFPTRTRGVVEKCNFCEERLARGEPPACVEACRAGALAFGDLADAGSGVRARLAERPAVRRRPALGTQPQVYYLL